MRSLSRLVASFSLLGLIFVPAAFARPAESVQARAAFTPSFPYGSQKVRGVNLGGWLVLEVSSTCLSVHFVVSGVPHARAAMDNAQSLRRDERQPHRGRVDVRPVPELSDRSVQIAEPLEYVDHGARLRRYCRRRVRFSPSLLPHFFHAVDASCRRVVDTLIFID